MLAYSVDPMRMIHFWGWGLYPAIVISMNRPLMLPMMMVDDDGHDHNNSGCSAKRPYGPWGVYALAASTAIGLCAIKDEGLELFLLISHFVIHLADINNNNRQSPAATTAIMPLIIMHHTKPTAQRSNTASHFDAPPAHQHQSSSIVNHHIHTRISIFPIFPQDSISFQDLMNLHHPQYSYLIYEFQGSDEFPHP